MIKLVTISGLDGSGKSTQTDLLEEYLRSKRKRVYRFHATNFSILNKMRNLFSVNRKKYTSSSDSEDTDNPVTKASKLSIYLRLWALPFDIWRFKRFMGKLDSKGFHVILADRYFYDTVVNIEYLGKKKQFLNMIPDPDLCIYLKINPQQIMKRDQPPKQGWKYLKEKFSIYERLFKDTKVIEVKASNRPDVVQRVIRTKLDSILGSI